MAVDMPPEGVIHFDPEHKVRAKKANGAAHSMRYEWEALPTDTPWLVKKRILRSGVGTLIGRGYTGKSHALVDLAWAVIVERNWAAEQVVRSGGVVYFTAEGGISIMRRFVSVKETSIKPWYDHMGGIMPDVFPFSICTDMPFQLLKQPEKAVDWFVARVQEAQAVYRDKCQIKDVPLVIFDTMARYAGFKNENDNAECTAAIQTLDAIGRQVDAFVLAADHLPKDEDAKKPRGGSSKFDNADVILRIETVGEGHARLLHVDKVRDGDSGQQVPFTLNVIERGTDADGDVITTVHLAWSDETDSYNRGGREPKMAPELLQCMDELFDKDMGERINTPHHGSVFAVPGEKTRQNWFCRVGVAGQSPKSLQDMWTRAVRQLKQRGVISTYTVEGKGNYIFRTSGDRTRQMATEPHLSPP